MAKTVIPGTMVEMGMRNNQMVVWKTFDDESSSGLYERELKAYTLLCDQGALVVFPSAEDCYSPLNVRHHTKALRALAR